MQILPTDTADSALNFFAQHEINKLFSIFRMFAVLDYLYGFTRENCPFCWEHNSNFGTIFDQTRSWIFPSQAYDIFAASNAFVYLA